MKRATALVTTAVRLGLIRRADGPRLESDYLAAASRQPGLRADDWLARRLAERGLAAGRVAELASAFGREGFRCGGCGRTSPGRALASSPVLVCPACGSGNVRPTGEAIEPASASNGNGQTTGQVTARIPTGGPVIAAPASGSATAEPQLPPTTDTDGVIAGCRIHGPLGTTSYGRLLSGQHIESGARARIALLDPDGRRPDARELGRLVGKPEPGIERLLAVAPHGKQLAIASECAPGRRTLRDTLARQGRADIASAVGMARSAATALEALHRRGVIHRNVCPDTLAFASRGMSTAVAMPGQAGAGAAGPLQVVDLGLAPRLRCSRDVARSGEVHGTPGYVAPELVAGRKGDARSDVYGLGCTLYTMLAGRAPYSGGADDVLIRHVGERVPDLPADVLRADPDRGQRLNALLQRMTARRPQDRPADMLAVRRELRAMLDPDASGAMVASAAGAAAVGAGELSVSDRAPGDVATQMIAGASPAGTRRVSRPITVSVPAPGGAVPEPPAASLPVPIRTGRRPSPLWALVPAALLLIVAGVVFALVSNSDDDTGLPGVVAADNSGDDVTPIGIEPPPDNADPDPVVPDPFPGSPDDPADPVEVDSPTVVEVPDPAPIDPTAEPGYVPDQPIDPAGSIPPDPVPIEPTVPGPDPVQPDPVDPDTGIDPTQPPLRTPAALAADAIVALFEDGEIIAGRHRLEAKADTPGIYVELAGRLNGPVLKTATREELASGIAPSDDAAVVAALLEAALHGDERVRTAALAALLKVVRRNADRPDRADIVAGARRAMTDPEPAVRLLGVELAGALAESTLARDLLTASSDPTERVRTAALRALARLVAADRMPESLAQTLLGRVRDALEDPEPEVRVAALVLAGELRDGSLLPAVLHLLRNDPDQAVRATARRTLELLGAATTAEQLRELVDSMRVRARLIHESHEDPQQPADAIRLHQEVSRVPILDTELATPLAAKVDAVRRLMDEVLAVWSDPGALQRLRDRAAGATAEELIELWESLHGLVQRVSASTGGEAPDSQNLLEFLAELEILVVGDPAPGDSVGWPQPANGTDHVGHPLHRLPANPADWPAATIEGIPPVQTRALRLRLVATPWAASAVGKVVAGFRQRYPRAMVEITTVPGTAAVQQALASDQADVAVVVAPFRSVWEQPGEAGVYRFAQLVPIGSVGVVLAVNPANGVTDVRLEDVRSIFTAQVREWSSLTGARGTQTDRILAMVPGHASATTAWLRDRVLGGEPVRGAGALEPDDAARLDAYVARNVITHPNALGLLSLLPAEPGSRSGIRLLAVDGFDPDPDTIRRGNYPLASELLLVRSGNWRPASAAGLFEQFLLATPGQRLLRDGGAMPRFPTTVERQYTLSDLLGRGVSLDATQWAPGRGGADELLIGVHEGDPTAFRIANNGVKALQEVPGRRFPAAALRDAPADSRARLWLASEPPPETLTQQRRWFNAFNESLHTTIVAHQTLAVIVHASNELDTIRYSDLRRMLTGSGITDWSGVPGAGIRTSSGGREPARGAIIRVKGPAEVVTLARRLISNRLVFHNRREARSAEQMVYTVAGSHQAIGLVLAGEFANLPERVRDLVRVVKVDGVPPSAEAVRLGDYRLSQPVTLATFGPLLPDSRERELADFLLSAPGRDMIERLGLVSPGVPIEWRGEVDGNVVPLSREIWDELARDGRYILDSLRLDEVMLRLGDQRVMIQARLGSEVLATHLAAPYFRQGDILLAINGATIRNTADVINACRDVAWQSEPTYTVVFLRNNVQRRITFRFYRN